MTQHIRIWFRQDPVVEVINRINTQTREISSTFNRIRENFR